jgi:hypothetical protein
MSSADILGGNVTDDVLEKAVERAKNLGKPVSMSKLIDEEEERKKREKEAALARERQRLEDLRKRKVVAKVKYTTLPVSPFDAFEIQPARERGWDYEKQLSEKQKAILLKMNIDPDSMPYAQSKQLLNEQFRRWKLNLCTIRQAAVLKKFGYATHDMTMPMAKQLLDVLARNHWKRPANEPTPAPEKVPF